MTRMSAFIAVAIVCSTAAFGQQTGVTGDTCVKLADVVAAGYSVSFSDRQFDAARYYANCEASRSSSSAGLSLAFSAFSLGTKLDEAASRAFCSKSYAERNISASEYNTTKLVFNQALATIDKCLEVAGRGWAIRYEQLTKDSISLNISHGNSRGGEVLGIDIIPAGALVCEPALPTSPKVVSTTDPFTTTCSRTPITRIIDGVERTSASESVLNLRLSDGVFPIRLPGYSSSVVDDINKRIEATRTELSQQTAAQTKTFEDFKNALTGKWDGNQALGPIAGGNPGWAESICPAGQYMVGLKERGSDPGTRYCVGCTDHFQVICRALPKN